MGGMELRAGASLQNLDRQHSFADFEFGKFQVGKYASCDINLPLVAGSAL